MGKKIDSFQAEDGQLFANERDMLVHEATVAVLTDFPELKGQINTLKPRLSILAAALAPLHAYDRGAKTEGSHTPESKGPMVTETTTIARPLPFRPVHAFACKDAPPLRPYYNPEQQEGCDCSAGMPGNSGPHHPSCPRYVNVGTPTGIPAPFVYKGPHVIDDREELIRV